MCLREDGEFQDVCSALFMVISGRLGSIILSPFSFPQPCVWLQFLRSAERRGGSCATLLCLTPSISLGQVSSAAPQDFHLRLLFDLTRYNEGKRPKDALECLGGEAALPAAAARGGEARPLPEVPGESRGSTQRCVGWPASLLAKCTRRLLASTWEMFPAVGSGVTCCFTRHTEGNRWFSWGRLRAHGCVCTSLCGAQAVSQAGL